MTKLYTYLLWVGIGLMVIIGVFFVVSTKQKLDTVATTNNISFSGEGKVLAKPDVAVIDFSIVTEAVSSKDAQTQNSAKSRKVNDMLAKLKIAEKDIRTTGYNIYPQYNYPRFDKPEIRGYQVNQSFEVKVRELDQVSSVLDGIVEAGTNQVSNFRFEIDDPEKLKAQARAAAIKDAKEKAQDLKAQLGIRLGRIVNFSEGSNGYPRPIFLETKAIGGGIGGDGPAVPEGENEIIVNVTITYQIK